MMVYVPAQGVVFTGDVVYVDRILGMHPVSRSKPWLTTFEALEALRPRIVVPGHGRVTDLAQAQRDTGASLRAHAPCRGRRRGPGRSGVLVRGVPPLRT